MTTAADYRIEEIRKVTLNGAARKAFKAYRQQGAAFVFIGAFSAPAKTANRDLWKIAASAQ